ncbi:MAG: c-type cytochrome [Myxococcales bacterium]
MGPLFAALCLASAAVPAPEAHDLYAKKCAVCHGDDGKGDTRMGRRFRAPDFTSAKWRATAKDAELRKVIENGVEEDGVHRMPAWKGKLSPDQIDALLQLIQGLGKR